MDDEILNVYFDHGKIALKNEFTFEHIIGQFQSKVRQILCVRNGYEVLIFRSPQMIPPNLRHGTTIVDDVSDTTQYFFYSNDQEEECYCFFSRQVYEWLISGRQIPFPAVRPPPVVIPPQEVVHSLDHEDSGHEDDSDFIGSELTADVQIDEHGAHKDVFSYQVRQ